MAKEHEASRPTEPSHGVAVNGPTAVDATVIGPTDSRATRPTMAGDAGAKAAAPPPPKSRRAWWLTLTAAGLLAAGYFAGPAVVRAFNTVSTDDAYVSGHVTMVAARVSGQVMRVMVDDNNRVHKGDLLVELDKEPYQVQVALKKAGVETAQADLAAAEDRMRGIAAQARSQRYRLEHAMEEVRNQVALLKANVAELKAEQANQVLAEQDFARGESLVGKGAISRQQFDQYQATLDVARNKVKAAEEAVQQIRAGLGLPANKENPLDVPEDLPQDFSTVRQALADLLVSAAALGVVPKKYDATPNDLIEEFYARDPSHDLDRIYAKLIAESSPIKQAQAQLHQAEAALAQAQLDLRYCDVLAEIDGVITRRNVNPGNNVQAGQALMAIRSLTDIWIDANFKETQIRELRIGQPVDVHIDMYGSHQTFEGRITGFTMGTGSTLALLPPQNATGNFVKVVQRLPVRIDLEDYDPQDATLFVGLSVVPYVRFKEAPTGPNAGKRLQEVAPQPASR